jgi:tripartite ATP-independent transporter DctM subunit
MELIIFLLFILLLCVGVPIGVALLGTGVAAFVFYPDIPIQLVGARLANAVNFSALLALPLFIFAAQILTDIKVTDAIFKFVNKCVGHVRGGLAQVNVLASVIFAGMSGSAVADAAGLGKVEIKAMNDQGYAPAFSAAITASSSTIGPILPPSIPVIIYGVLAEVSIGKLLIGGFLPGIIMAVLLMIGIFIIAERRKYPKYKFAGFREIWRTGCKAIPGLMAPVILIGGMLFGIFTPTEAASVAVVYAIAVGFMLKSLTLKELWQSLKQAAFDSAVIIFVLLSASLVSLIATRLRLADSIISFISGFTTSPVVVLVLINILLLIAGCLLEAGSCIVLFTPILVPIAKSFGIDLIHFGIVMILNLMIGLITPPLGLTMFITSKIAEIKAVEFLKECYPFMILLIGALIIVTYVPQTVLWLPSLFIK